MQAPIAIGGQSVLAAAALAVQAYANVELPIGRGQRRPLSLYMVTCAATGERKSACDEEAMGPTRRHETALREQYDVDIMRYANDRDAYEQARKQALNPKGRSDRGSVKAALESIGPAPVPPLTPLLTCPEPTYEGMCRLLAGGRPSIGIFSAEGGQFIGGHGMTEEARLRTAAGLSELWDGAPVCRVRAGDGTTILPGRRVSLHLMAQAWNRGCLARRSAVSRSGSILPDVGYGAGQRDGEPAFP